jgi:CRISPR-associated protein Cst1
MENNNQKFPFIYRFTGNPFVDGGIAALCALNNKGDPESVNKEDLERSIEFIVRIYPKWQKLRHLFTQNCILLHPAIKNKAERYEEYLKRLVHKISNAYSDGDCALCGIRKSSGLVLRHEYPLTGSGDFVNYFSFFEPGLPLCPACTFALQFVPLFLVSNNGILFLTHSHSERFMLTLAKKAVTHIRTLDVTGQTISYYIPFAFKKNDRYEFLVKLVHKLVSEADSPFGRISVRLYYFINSGKVNSLNFIDLPTDIFVFIEKAIQGGLKRNFDAFLKKLSPRIYQALIEEKNLWYYFLQQKERELIGGWELFDLYLREVEKMDPNRLEVLKKVGKNLYEYLNSDNFRKLKDLEAIEKYGDFRLFLTKAQKERIIWEMEDELLLFPQDKDGAIRWRETQLILLAYIYEQMHKNNKKVN